MTANKNIYTATKHTVLVLTWEEGMVVKLSYCPLKKLLTLHSSSEQGYSEMRGDGSGAGFPHVHYLKLHNNCVCYHPYFDNDNKCYHPYFVGEETKATVIT